MIIKSGTRERCPHCSTTVQFVTCANGMTGVSFASATQVLGVWGVTCPSCDRLVLSIQHQIPSKPSGWGVAEERVIWPLAAGRSPVPLDVPRPIAEDFVEAALVLPLSPKASAALSRRCLQAILREAGGTKSRDLADQINEVMERIPSYLGEQLDAVRNTGNFAAHPLKSTSTGMIVDVEPHEAEWNLDVLEALFDFYFVQPAQAAKRRAALNAKLTDVGKPPMK